MEELGLRRARRATRAPYAAGAAGIRQSIDAVASKMREARHDPELRRWAIDSLTAAGCDGRTHKCSIRTQAQALLSAVRASTTYVSDPENTEWAQSAHVTLCLRDVCIPGGDCDDLTIALGGAMLSVGLPARAVKQSFGGSAQEHILVGLLDEYGEKLYADAANTKEGSVYTGSRAEQEIWIDPFGDAPGNVGAGAEIVTLGAAPEPRNLSRVGGFWVEERYGKRFAHDGKQWRPVGLGAGFVTPMRVLAYRETWDPYVLGVGRAALALADVYDALSNGQAASVAIDFSSWGAPPSSPPNASDKQRFATKAIGWRSIATTIESGWNAFAGYDDKQITLEAAGILQTFQKEVLSDGKIAEQIRGEAPSLSLPTPPAFDLQAEVIGDIEGAQILAHGVLQLIGVGAAGALATYGALGEFAKQAVTKTLDLTPWIIVGVVAVSAAYVASVGAPLFRELRKKEKKA